MSQPIQLIKVVGFDPSLRNWGIAKGDYNLWTNDLRINEVGTFCPVLSQSKQVRQNSQDLESARQLYWTAVSATQDAHAVFVEVPIGSQSARAMASYGICMGVLGALSVNTPIFEVTPAEVKLAGPGKKTASKLEMIEWAMQQHPNANWPLYRKNGKQLISEGKAEHQADAVGAIYAGIISKPFQQLLPMLKAA